MPSPSQSPWDRDRKQSRWLPDYRSRGHGHEDERRHRDRDEYWGESKVSSRKKQRLGWGEGLAKYEKKKPQPQPQNSTSPSSVACSSSPGIEDKSVKETTNDQDNGNLSGSPSAISEYHSEGLAFNLDDLDLAQIANLSSSINDLLLSDEPSSMDSSFMRSTALNKLLVWKCDISKALEKTEAEIDSLENELKRLISEPENSQLVLSASRSLPKECKFNSQEVQGTNSNFVSRSAPLQVVIPQDLIREEGTNIQEARHAEIKAEDIDSPGSATSKFVELPPEKDVAHVDAMKRGGEMLISADRKSRSLNVEVCCSAGERSKLTSSDVKVCTISDEKAKGALACKESSFMTAGCSLSVSDGSVNCEEDTLYNIILSANKDSAHRAFEVFKNLLPGDKCIFDLSRAVSVSSLQIDHAVKERFTRRKQFQRFKEKIIALKFRIHQHLWKEDIHMLSVRRFRAKSQRKFDPSLRPVQIGPQKLRSTVRSRFSTAVGNFSLVPSSEILNFASRLLSDPGTKVFRNTLRMPALILDQRERTVSRFITKNSLVEDPFAAEKERSLINPWTSEEREIFIDKLATFGKDFRKISSFLDHKTIADCIEFYYKNHKSECFERMKKKPDYSKQEKVCSANTYLVASSGKRWNREANSVSLDILGAASAIAANVEDSIEIQQKDTSKLTVQMVTEYKASRHNELERSNSLDDICHSERETVAADVLAGICGSLSSEAVSSCITTSADPGEGNQEFKHQKLGSSTRLSLTPEVTQSVDEETCSDESCGEMDPTDWTDEEKSIFIQAVAAYGKDFVRISRCVRTRSRDQCKIFFSKARKCLGLDKILPVSGSLLRQDTNDRSDPDACFMETELCNEKSSLKLEEVSDLCVNGGISKPDMSSSDDKDVVGELDSADTEHLNSVKVDCHVDKQELVEFSGDCEIQVGSSHGHGDVNMVEGVLIDGDVSEKGLPDLQCAKEVPGKHTEEEVKGVSSLSDHGLEDIEAEVEIAGASRSNCSVENVKSNIIPSQGNSHPDTSRGSELCPLNGFQNMAHLDSESQCKPDVSYLENNLSVQKKQMPQSSSAESILDLEPENRCDEQSEVAKQPFLSSSGLAHVESCQILGSYSLGESAVKEAGDSGCSTSAALPEFENVGRNLLSDPFSTSGCFLRKCNGTIHDGSVLDHSTPNREQVGGDGSSNGEKPCRNGDVKLFGQILSKPCPQQNPGSNVHQYDGSIHLMKVCSNSLNASHSLEGSSATGKFEHNNFLGSESRPVRSFGFWDGNRIQTGFSSLPDSAILLAKYPAAFGNYAMPSTKMEQQPPPFHGVVKTTERNLNGVPVFPARDASSSNGVGGAADYQVYSSRDVPQPFTIEMKQRQDVLLSEMQRRNGFDLMSGMQQQVRGVVVGRGGILVGGGQCTVSDPVAAIKMHYAKAAEQFSGQASIVSSSSSSSRREDDSWRSKGDMGR